MAPGFWTPRMVMHRWLDNWDQTDIGLGIRRNTRGFHHNGDTARFDGLLYGNSNLFGEALLDLQTATESLRYASKLGNSKDEFVRDIGDSNLVLRLK